MLMTPNKLPTEVRLYSDVESPKVRWCERADFEENSFEHTFGISQHFEALKPET